MFLALINTLCVFYLDFAPFFLSVHSNELGKTVNATSKLGKAKVESTLRSSPDISGKTQVSQRLIVAGDKATN